MGRVTGLLVAVVLARAAAQPAWPDGTYYRIRSAGTTQVNGVFIPCNCRLYYALKLKSGSVVFKEFREAGAGDTVCVCVCVCVWRCVCGMMDCGGGGLCVFGPRAPLIEVLLLFSLLCLVARRVLPAPRLQRRSTTV